MLALKSSSPCRLRGGCDCGDDAGGDGADGFAGAAAAKPAQGKIEVKVLSSRYDLVSGGDALVEVKASEGAKASELQADAQRPRARDAAEVRPADATRCAAS